jgi:hypothetical protein
MAFSSRSFDRDLAGILQGVAFALMLVFLVSELKQLLPPALLQPAWQLRAAEALRNIAVLPLMAGVLLLLARRFDPFAAGLEWRLLLFRRLAIAASIGFLLLIPLQITAGLLQINQTTAVEARQLEAVRQVAVAIEQANSTEAMNKAIARLPGLPSDFQGRYTLPLDQVRPRLLSQIRPQIQRLEERLKQLRRQRLGSASGLFVLDGLLSLAYAIAFAALASGENGAPSLLQQIIWNFKGLARWFRGKEASSRSKGPVDEQWIRSLQDEEESSSKQKRSESR